MDTDSIRNIRIAVIGLGDGSGDDGGYRLGDDFVGRACGFAVHCDAGDDLAGVDVAVFAVADCRCVQHIFGADGYACRMCSAVIDGSSRCGKGEDYVIIRAVLDDAVVAGCGEDCVIGCIFPYVVMHQSAGGTDVVFEAVAASAAAGDADAIPICPVGICVGMGLTAA